MSKVRRLWLLTCVALALLVFWARGQTALGADAFPPDTGTYPHGALGYDVSFPQCERGFPDAPLAFGIVGVTHGHAFTYNPCLRDAFGWAQQASGAAPSLYMNLNYATGWSAANGRSGPKGDCAPGDEVCKAYNYGYNAAQDAFAYAYRQGAGAQIWWIDVETMNSWSEDTALNDVVIQAAADFFVGRGTTAGVYSTRLQWNTIAGTTFVPALSNGASLPLWIATGANNNTAARFCSPAHAFGGGRVWLVQFASGEYDLNYAC
jgi:hypothetical protein